MNSRIRTSMDVVITCQVIDYHFGKPSIRDDWTKWLNRLHKFSDGTLTRVIKKLDQMVKDFHLYEYNKGMETRKWSEEMTREEAKTSSQQSRKDYRSEGSIEVSKALLEDE
ncbi:hypothetical protein Tco_0148580 [Tanacetum coccineum]